MTTWNARPAGATNERFILAPEALQWMQTWFSPAFPTGAFSYSHGLEWLVETAAVDDAETLFDWVEGVLRHGAARSEAVFLCTAWRQMCARDWTALEETTIFAAALQPTAERRIECLEQGDAFLAAVRTGWPHPDLDEFAKICPADIPAPIAAGIAGAVHDMPLDALTVTFLQGFAAALVSAGVRLIPLGQSDWLRILRMLEPVTRDIAAEAMEADASDVGSAALLTDIASQHHETQHARLFRS